MKKGIILTILMSLSLFSCNKKENIEKELIEGNYNNISAYELSISSLKEKILKEDNFVLYVYTEGCSACASFDNVLNSFIIESKATIYKTSFTDLENENYFDNKPVCSESPSLFIYHEGKLVSKESYLENESVFKGKDALKEYIYKYFYNPRLIEVSETNIQSFKDDNKSFIVYVGWNKCSDCKLLYNRVLNSYLKDNDKILYYLESDEYRSKKPSTFPTLGNNPTIEEQEKYNEDLLNYNNWISFATRNNFVSYREGKVPALVYYENGIYSDYLVYHNDVIVEGIVTTSFFEELIGKNMDDDTLTEYHNTKAKEFLNKYL